MLTHGLSAAHRGSCPKVRPSPLLSVAEKGSRACSPAFSLAVVTIELNKGGASWFNATAGNSTSRTSGLSHYRGDF